MCGLVGQFSRECHDPAIIHHLTSLMERRGPDDVGVWSDQKYCSFGFRRLSILDLTPTGHQPMETPDGRYVLVFNGELYNFQTIRHELKQLGCQFRSTGDTEVVLYALVQWGAAALERFNGMYALGFYDSSEKRLLLARDHVGIKPLYYSKTEQGIVFASQYDQILAHPFSQNLPISRAALALYLRLGHIPAPYAILQNTHMLEPGTWVEADANGRFKKGRYFEFPRYQKPDLFGREAMEAVDTAVTQAVGRQMISDVPLGTFLSGGIDSPLVASKMKALSNHNIKAFTIGTNGDQFDESAGAAQYASEIGLIHKLHHVTADDALALLDDVGAATGEPFADFSIFPTMLVSRLARQEVTVMLSGDGGDELFWGYAGRFGSVLRSVPDFQQPQWWRNIRWGLKKYFKVGNGYYNLRMPGIGDWYRAKHTHLPETWSARIFPDLPLWPSAYTVYDNFAGDVDQTAQWLRWNEMSDHLTRVLLKVDRASMYHSLEVRVPLLDREVIDVGLRVDWRSCLDIERGVGKLPLRQALAKHISSQSQRKRGFHVPMGEWMRGPLCSVFEQEMISRNELLGLTMNQSVLKEMFNQHLTRQKDHGWSLWLLLSLGRWADHYFQKDKINYI